MIITYVAGCVAQSSDRPSAGQEMPRSLWSMEVNCCGHKSMPEREREEVEREVESFVAM